MQPGLIQPITPSDTVPVAGASTILCVAAGDVVFKGTQTGAVAVGAVTLTEGQQLYVPDTFYVMATGTTATLAAFG